MVNHPNRSKKKHLRGTAAHYNPGDDLIRHDIHGWYILTETESAFEDEGNPSVGLDGRPHYPTLELATEAYDAGEA